MCLAYENKIQGVNKNYVQPFASISLYCLNTFETRLEVSSVT